MRYKQGLGHDANWVKEQVAGNDTVVIWHDMAECIVHMPDGKAEANARRIAACLNACEGIPTERLEGINISELEMEHQLLCEAAAEAWIFSGAPEGGFYRVREAALRDMGASLEPFLARRYHEDTPEEMR